MKKLLSFVFVICFCLSSTVFLASCSHTHSFSKNWVSDSNIHYHVCKGKGCDERSDVGEHEFEIRSKNGVYSYVCKVCGLEKIHDHVISNDYSSDATTHWRTCTAEGCDYRESEDVHHYDDGEIFGDKVIFTCTVCHHEYEISKHEHDFFGDYISNETYHWKECRVEGCVVKDQLSLHEYDSGVKTDNQIIFSCKVCGRQMIHTHDFSGEYVYDTENHWKECTVGNCTEKSLIGAHSFLDGVVRGDKEVFVCKVCGFTFSRDALAQDSYYYINSVESLLSENYALKISNLELNVQGDNFQGSFIVDFAELNLTLAQDGKFAGYGSGNILDSVTRQLFYSAKAVISDSKLYLYLDSKSPSQILVCKYDFENLKTLIIPSNDTYESLVQPSLGEIAEKFKGNRDQFNDLLEMFFTGFFNKKVTFSSTVSTFNPQKIIKINQRLNTVPFSTLYNEVFGDGSYRTLTNRIADSIPKTLGQVISDAKEDNIDILDILNKLDVLSRAYGPMLLSYPGIGKGSVDLEINKFEDLLRAFDINLPFEDISDYLEANENMKFYQFLNEMTGKKLNSLEYQILIRNIMPIYGLNSFYAIIENVSKGKIPMAQIKVYIDEVAGYLDDMYDMTYTVSADGVILSGELSVHVPGEANGKIELVKDYKSINDYSSIIPDIASFIGDSRIVVSSLPILCDEFMRDTYTTAAGESVVRYRGNTDDTVYEFVFVDETLSKINCTIGGRRYELRGLNENYNICIETLSEDYYQVSIYSAEGKTIDNGKETIGASITLLFDAKKGEYIICLDRDKFIQDNIHHNFILMEMQETKYGYLLHYQCIDCDDEYFTQVFTLARRDIQKMFNSTASLFLKYYTDYNIYDLYFYRDGFIYGFSDFLGGWALESDQNRGNYRELANREGVGRIFVKK